MGATEITQDVPSDLTSQSVSYCSYKSRLSESCNVSPSGAVLYTAELYPGSILDIAIVGYNKLLEKFQDSDLIQADKGYKIYHSLPQCVSFNIPPIP